MKTLIGTPDPDHPKKRYTPYPMHVFHSPDNLKSYMDPILANAMTCIDIDGVEYCRDCMTIVAYVEYTMSHRYKHTFITETQAAAMTSWYEQIAAMDDEVYGIEVPAYLVVFDVDQNGECERFLVTNLSNPRDRRLLSKQEFALWIPGLREEHWRSGRAGGGGPCPAGRYYLDRLEFERLSVAKDHRARHQQARIENLQFDAEENPWLNAGA